MTKADGSKQERRWKSLSSGWRQFLGFVVLPTVLVFIYCAFIESPMYVSETQFAVRSSDDRAQSGSAAGTLFASSGLASLDAAVVYEYIGSHDIFEKLNANLKLIEHYSDSSKDVISRLPAKPTLYEQDLYWSFATSTKLDVETGIIKFYAKAYSPEMAQAITSQVLAESEALVNQMNYRARNDAMELARKEVDNAQARLAAIQQKMKEFRSKHKELDPKAAATGLQNLVLQLEGQMAAVKAQIAESSTYMRPDAPAMVGLRNKLKALETQIAQEKNRIVSIESEKGINSWVTQYESLVIESEFAQKQLTSSMAALESARLALVSQARYVVAIEKPTKPDEARFPRVWEFTLCVFLSLLLLFGIGKLIYASVREHAGY